MKFRKKPIVIDALKFVDDSPDTLCQFSVFMGPVRISYRNPRRPVILIQTPEGEMSASIGDWIIRGISGEYYPCKPDIFEKSYESINLDE